MKVLCMVAHPDDEIIGVGGTLARHVARGDEVRICVLAEAERARHDEFTPEVERLVENRRDGTRRACEHLGVDSVEFYTFPDNQFDAVPLLDIVKIVEYEIAEFEPEVIYTHHFGDLNVSHELTCRAVVTAARPLPGSSVKRILAFETLSNSEWAVPTEDHMFNPTVFVDISDHLEAKLAALAEHETELEPHPHPRNLENVRRNALVWGSKSGLEAAEAFVLLREVDYALD